MVRISSVVKPAFVLIALVGSVSVACNAATSPPTQPVFGYLNSSPAAFLRPESGMSVDIFDAVYDPQMDGLVSYQLRFRYPSGEVMELGFHNIAFSPATGFIVGYSVSIAGKDVPGPTIEEFETSIPGLGEVIAFSISPFAGSDPFPVVTIPCEGNSNVEYESVEGRQQILRQVTRCAAQTYTLQYSDYAYDNQFGILAGYSVLVEIAP